MWRQACGLKQSSALTKMSSKGSPGPGTFTKPVPSRNHDFVQSGELVDDVPEEGEISAMGQNVGLSLVQYDVPVVHSLEVTRGVVRALERQPVPCRRPHVVTPLVPSNDTLDFLLDEGI